jgi:hypothetical protein
VNETDGKTIEMLNDALQVVVVLSSKLRRELSESAQEAVDLEAAAWRATAAVRRLRPNGGNR